MRLCSVDDCEKVPDKHNRMFTAHRQRKSKYGSTDLPVRTLGDCEACGASMAHLPVTPRLRRYCGSKCLLRVKVRRQAERRKGGVASIPMPKREDGERPGISVEDFLAAQRPSWARESSPVPDAWSRRGDVMDGAAGAP